uniref:Uncharacterized protein n=1 Tax=Opuntia streptacantha TaxID=393608 RepID=A0A7C8ZUT4_OPUST
MVTTTAIGKQEGERERERERPSQWLPLPLLLQLPLPSLVSQCLYPPTLLNVTLSKTPTSLHSLSPTVNAHLEMALSGAAAGLVSYVRQPVPLLQMYPPAN